MKQPLDETETVVGLAGDWEGNRIWARHALATFAEREVTSVFHLGDLGLLPGPRARQFLSEVDGSCRRHGITIYLLAGNHDDYARIRTLPVDGGGLAWATEHLAVLPRGHRWTMGGRSFVALGGAPSVDYPSRIEGKTWWPEEMITEADIARVVAGGHADIMLTHDAPAPSTPEVERIIRTGGGYDWTDRGLDHVAVGRARVTEAFQAVRPYLLAHAHFHVHDEALVHPDGWSHACRVLSFNNDGKYGNLALLDLQDGGAEAAPRHGWL